ncbi:hypothetical protein GGI25_000359 [Coemansia spiralis]|uniref:DSBA-like thioredoxin domain-containing protein n=2 Tax=Coemansia TaxID=4863 RepID=A0A9W8G850_9FUNG|nr:thioredoxin-like protein [Coemansia spiralis]KAJ1996296.1 hypothetical protein EDC05_000186 [Coemansia umbellata]KAJ2625947.1 hypothetical protein GGI26_000031 [Coemansia sp. RSA 1358]KAJ2680724.1 hypothetical protein GGI25_000359 [Coemansia spiralis]
MAPQTLSFWFEFASPYSMISALRLFRALTKQTSTFNTATLQGIPSCQIPDLSEVDVVYMPILLGPIFKASGQQMLPNVQVPLKGKYMFHDVERTLNLLGCSGFPRSRPATWPPNTVLPARMAWLLAQGPEYIHAVDAESNLRPSTASEKQQKSVLKVVAEFVWRVYEAEFIANENIGDPDVMARLWDKFVVQGFKQDGNVQMPNGGRAVALANLEVVKSGLKGATQEAIANGLFGAPMFTTDDGDMYWGNDRLLDAFAHCKIQERINQPLGFCAQNRQPNL